MVANINYNNIKDLKPEEAYNYIAGLEKSLVKQARMCDIVNVDFLDKAIHEFKFIDLSFRGVYMFFDPEGHARYIGQTNASFYERLPTQLDTWFYQGFGWNSMLRILGGKRTGKPHYLLTEKDHEHDLEEVLNYKLLLIKVDRSTEIDGNGLIWIEKVLLKTYRKLEEEKLINGRIGWLRNEHWNMTIDNIIKS